MAESCVPNSQRKSDRAGGAPRSRRRQIFMAQQAIRRFLSQMSIAYLANLLSNTVNAQVPVHVYVERDADKETLVKDLAAHMGVTAINLE